MEYVGTKELLRSFEGSGDVARCISACSRCRRYPDADVASDAHNLLVTKDDLNWKRRLLKTFESCYV